MKPLLTSLALLALCAGSPRAASAATPAPASGSAPAQATSETFADRKLRQIVERQKELFADAMKQGDKLDMGAFQVKAQSLVQDYELLIRDNPKFAAAIAAYGYFLSKVDMRKEAAAMLIRADQLDRFIPLVKNQLGTLLAEDGKPKEALGFFLAAVKLEPTEPLYHYQLATLLAEARADFLKSGEWTREAIDTAMSDGFRRAAELAPERFEFAYRYAESFYDLEKPDWTAALKLWSALEEKAPSAIERQTMRLHAANIFIKLGQRDHAKALLAAIDAPDLAAQKAKVAALLEEPAKP